MAQPKKFDLEKLKEDLDLYGRFVIVIIEYVPDELYKNGILVSMNIKPHDHNFYAARIVAVGDGIRNSKLEIDTRVLVRSHTGMKVYYLDGEDDFVKFEEHDIYAIIDEDIDLTPIKNFITPNQDIVFQ